MLRLGMAHLVAWCHWRLAQRSVIKNHRLPLTNHLTNARKCIIKLG